MRASGTPFVTWVTVRLSDFHVLSGQLVHVEWATRVRGCCGRCGTALIFQAAEDPDKIDVTVCSLDEPESITPTDHIWVEDRLPWVKLADGLPSHKRERPAR